jgi:hypothetical protein
MALLIALHYSCAVKKALEAGFKVRTLKLAPRAFFMVMSRNLRQEPVSRFMKARIA